MDETQMQHGVDWTGQDVSGWIGQEKYNGCRAYWDGSRMWSRGGLDIIIPEEMRSALPSFPLDGELYHPAKSPASISHIMRGQGNWDGVIFMAFDAPGKGSFTDRMTLLESLDSSPSLRIAHAFPINSTDEAISTMKKITWRKGEGIILRRPNHRYAPGRTDDILKMKPALVVTHG